MIDYLLSIGLALSVLAVFLACSGCKFTIKEYSSSIGELSAETTKGL